MMTLCCEALAKQYGHTIERNNGWKLFTKREFDNEEDSTIELTIYFCPFCGFKLQNLNKEIL